MRPHDPSEIRMARRREREPETGIELKLSVFPLAFLLYLCTPHAEINGRVKKLSWGTHFFPLKPGRHEVSVWFPYMWMSECGLNTVEFKLREDEVKLVTYDTPFIMGMKGSMSVREL